jgi:hypothetical protein
MHYPYRQRQWIRTPECPGEQFDLDVKPPDENVIHRICGLTTSTVIDGIDDRLAESRTVSNRQTMSR